MSLFRRYYIYGERIPRKQSILELSKDIVAVVRRLRDFDQLFNYASLVADIDYPIDSIESPYCENLLAEEILKAKKKEIKKYEEIDNLNVDFCRDSPSFVVSIKFKSEGKGICLTFTGGSINEWKLNTLSLEKGFNPGFKWWKGLLEAVASSLDFYHVGVKFNDVELMKKSNKKYKFPLGWIDYFSNASVIQLPRNISSLTYEHVFNGVIVYSTEKDFSVCDEGYNEYGENLENMMVLLKTNCPAYGLKGSD
jgi:hypothetical protein